MRGWLVALGIAEIAGASVFVLMAACTLLVAVIGNKLPVPKGSPPVQVSDVLVSTGICLGIAAVWLVLGLGSIFPRRWARSVTLALSWIWLLIGISSTLLMACTGLPPPAPGQPAMPPEVAAVATLVMVAVMAVFMCVLPAVLIVFHQHPRVRETFETRDPFARWTDGCPVPVLIASFMAAGIVLGVGPLLAHNCVIPVFGYALSGTAGGVALAIMVVIALWVARGLFHLDPTTWRVALTLMCLGVVSSMVTAARLDYAETYTLMGLSKQQIQQVTHSGFGPASAKWCWIPGLLQLGYLVYLRRYFFPKRA